MRRAGIWTGIWAAGALAVSPAPALAEVGAGMGAYASPPARDEDRALRCMTLAIAYEAGYETARGQQAVGEVILNRTHHPAYPKSVCGVVFQGSSRRTGCQFTFTCDGAMRRVLPLPVMAGAQEAARRVLAGDGTPLVGGATHYHANYVAPYWAPSLIRIGRIGAHIFYRAPGSVDSPARYALTREPEIARLGSWLTAIDPLTQGRAAAAAAPPAQPEPPRTFAPWGLAITPAN